MIVFSSHLIILANWSIFSNHLEQQLFLSLIETLPDDRWFVAKVKKLARPIQIFAFWSFFGYWYMLNSTLLNVFIANRLQWGVGVTVSNVKVTNLINRCEWTWFVYICSPVCRTFLLPFAECNISTQWPQPFPSLFDLDVLLISRPTSSLLLIE